MNVGVVFMRRNTLTLLRPIDYVLREFYLEREMVESLNQKCDSDPEKRQMLINELLRKDRDIAQRVTVAVGVEKERSPVGRTTDFSLPTNF